ncbi:unnamed protein product [Clonostachys solani]|uniref:F-box domain-containing protein n=1 Tax=Clonostachys solani TaxID=160281 RepID=A0A9N9Z8C0_9HYPO|nr:unnamed protein product [Clonostachys solani]
MAQATGVSFISTMPPELRHEILAHCPDPLTMQSLALSCKAFYSTYSADPDRILTSVVLGSVHRSVQPVASAALAASKLPAGDVAAFQRFKDEHLEPQQGAPGYPTGTSPMSDILLLARLHDHVTYFADAISHEMLGRLPVREAGGSMASEPSGSHPSATELLRMQRAIYVFQIFCHIFDREPGYRRSNGRNFPPIDVWRACYPKFAQYEVEQQICLHEYFMVLIARGFNEIVQHDVTWGYLGVDPITSTDSTLGQEILLRGLDTLRALSEAGNYQDIRSVLHGGERRTDGPLPSSSDFVNRMEHINKQGTYPQFNPEVTFAVSLTFLNHVRAPLYQDPECGPVRAWETVFCGDLHMRVLRHRYIRIHRRRGYVFWDLARLEKQEFSGARWETDQAPDPIADYWTNQMLNPPIETVLMSRERRSEIWKAGGRGWWSFDDESKVVYPHELTLNVVSRS